ncbi:sensor histidine kinase [Halioxenophilus sp. WMMB6]|uniref:sensor histidine kinase n=1 Tax=Halioxenophilus sp. WMMB6 TaxID=3073815 RepID=UPI00295EB34F|nr:ATP-binding protein [Halioxenophilus sp. WMMB6]
MSLSSLESQSIASNTRKPSPLLAVARKKKQSPEQAAALTSSFHLLEHRVDELNQQLHELQSEKEYQDEQNQVLHGRLSAVIDVVPAGIVILDANGVITEFNSQAQQLLECSLQGRLWREVLQECFKRRLDDGHEISTTTGRRLSISTRSLGEQQRGQIVLLSDQTETRRLQALVSHQQRLAALGQMVSALAHQIRTPLSAALLYAAHLCDQPLPEPQREKFSHKLRSRLQHMERQVRDMLLFVKGELPLNDRITGEQFVAEFEEALEVPVREFEATINWHIATRDFTLRCNRDALVNALLNLVNNALQAYEECSERPFGKRIDITLTLVHGKLQIAVRDFGPGIKPEVIARLNQPFVTTKPQGTGLGLSVVRAVANAHQGSFSLQPLEQGVEACLSVPLLVMTQPQ